MAVAALSLSESRQTLDPAVWLASLSETYDDAARACLERACILAQANPHFEQALGSASVLSSLRMDYQTVATALAMHTPLDGPAAVAALKENLGAEIAALVEGVSRLGRMHHAGIDLVLDQGKKNPVNQAEALRKMLLAMAEDIRVVLILLADQVQLLRRLIAPDHPGREQAAREAQEIFAPLANRLGIWQIKWELEDLALRIRQPARYKKMAQLLDERRADREAYLADVSARLRAELSSAGVAAEVTARPKHIYSIWRKMNLKHLDFDQVYDIRALRVLVDDVKACYGALGVVHGLWQPIPGEFDDYIAHPKANNYRSLHTAVIGPEGKALEVQIRTREMHSHAEYGVAAHWRYKEGAQAASGEFDEKIAWLRQLLAWKDEVADASEWVQQFKTELFHDRIYVLTPQGKVIDLPQGAKPLDFAYAVHTDLGHRCRGAKVNGNIVPLTYSLKNAERVEILSVKQGAPSRDWLSPGYLVTSRAKAKVRQWLNAQNSEDHIAQGKEILARETARLGITSFNQEKLAQKFDHARLEDFLIALGRGDYRTSQLTQALQEWVVAKPQDVNLPPSRTRAAPRSPQGDVLIEGIGSLAVSYGKCCKPVPPDAIAAYITRARGVVVHRQDCGNISRLKEDRHGRLLQASWNSAGNALHAVDISLTGDERPGLLRDILAVLTAEKAATLSVNSETRGGLTDVYLSLEVKDLSQLNRIMLEVKKVIGVKTVRRA